MSTSHKKIMKPKYTFSLFYITTYLHRLKNEERNERYGEKASIYKKMHNNKLLGQGYVKERLKEILWSVRESYQTIWGPTLPNVTTFLMITTYNDTHHW